MAVIGFLETWANGIDCILYDPNEEWSNQTLSYAFSSNFQSHSFTFTQTESLSYGIGLNCVGYPSESFIITYNCYLAISYTKTFSSVLYFMTNMLRFVNAFIILTIAFAVKGVFGNFGFPIGLILGAAIFYISGGISIFELIITIVISAVIFYYFYKRDYGVKE